MADLLPIDPLRTRALPRDAAEQEIQATILAIADTPEEQRPGDEELTRLRAHDADWLSRGEVDAAFGDGNGALYQRLVAHGFRPCKSGADFFAALTTYVAKADLRYLPQALRELHQLADALIAIADRRDVPSQHFLKVWNDFARHIAAVIPFFPGQVVDLYERIGAHPKMRAYHDSKFPLQAWLSQMVHGPAFVGIVSSLLERAQQTGTLADRAEALRVIRVVGLFSPNILLWCIRQLTGTDPDLRGLAFDVLDHAMQTETWDAFIEYFAMASHTDLAAVTHLIATLSTTSDEDLLSIRARLNGAIIDGVAETANPAGRSYLHSVIVDRQMDLAFRYRAIKALTKQGDRGILPLLFQALADPAEDLQFRMEAFSTSETFMIAQDTPEIAADVTSAEYAGHLAAMVTVLRTPLPKKQREEILQALRRVIARTLYKRDEVSAGLFSPALLALCRTALFDHPDLEVREEMFLVLDGRRLPDLVTLVAQVLQDPKQPLELRERAANLLRYRAVESADVRIAVRAFRIVLADPATDPALRHAVDEAHETLERGWIPTDMYAPRDGLRVEAAVGALPVRVGAKAGVNYNIFEGSKLLLAPFAEMSLLLWDDEPSSFHAVVGARVGLRLSRRSSAIYLGLGAGLHHAIGSDLAEPTRIRPYMSLGGSIDLFGPLYLFGELTGNLYPYQQCPDMLVVCDERRYFTPLLFLTGLGWNL